MKRNLILLVVGALIFLSGRYLPCNKKELYKARDWYVAKTEKELYCTFAVSVTPESRIEFETGYLEDWDGKFGYNFNTKAEVSYRLVKLRNAKNDKERDYYKNAKIVLLNWQRVK